MDSSLFHFGKLASKWVFKKTSESFQQTPLEQMIRVNHAGEYGAKQIYKGQLFVLGHDETIAHMAEQEQEHLDAFTHILIDKGIRPSLLQPLWHVGGFALGAMTAWMGRDFAHTCTVAVETVIDEHYQSQIATLQKSDGEVKTVEEAALTALIEKCRADECEHKDIANQEAGVDLSERYPITSGIIRCITRTAIEIAKRI